MADVRISGPMFSINADGINPSHKGYDVVVERAAQSNSYAGDAWGNAWALLNDMAGYVVDADSYWKMGDWVAVDDGGISGINADDPPLPSIRTDIDVAVPAFVGTAPVMPAVDINIEAAPQFNVADPAFNIPEAPTVAFPTFTENAPGISSPNIPLAPAFDLPAVPSLSAISIPSPPEYNLPDFDGVPPVADLTPPEPMFVWNEAEYSSDIRTQLANKLLSDLVNGGSGLPDATEQAIYDRATARQELEHNQMYDEALSFFSSRGWRLPPGALSGRLVDVSYKINQVREDLNNDILVQQSKLAQENTHFIIDRAIQNEKNLMDYINVLQQRAFDAAKYVVEAALTIYQIKVEAYKAQLEVYKVKAQVFETRIRAEVAKAELFKAQIEGIKASVDAQRLMIEAYKAQVESIMIYIEVYKAEMEGAKIEAEINSVRIQSFMALVKAYEARVGAVTERYKAYQAQIAGEETKAKMYAAQVDGYKSRVEAYKAKADVEIAEVTAQVELNRGRVESFKAEIEKYKALVSAAVEQARADVEIEKLDVAVFEAEIQKYSEELKAMVALFNGKVEEAKAKMSIEAKEAEVTTQVALAKYTLMRAASEAAAKVAAQMAAAAMSMVSASAAVGFQESDRRAISASVSGSNNLSMSESESTSHTFYKDVTTD